MAIITVYEQQYYLTGWEDSIGLNLPSWWDRDLANTGGAIIKLVILEPVFVFDDPVFFSGPDVPVQLPPGTDNRPRPMLPAQVQPHITVEVLPAFFDDGDTFFLPMAVRALDAPDKMLQNEVIRVR